MKNREDTIFIFVSSNLIDYTVNLTKQIRSGQPNV